MPPAIRADGCLGLAQQVNEGLRRKLVDWSVLKISELSAGQRLFQRRDAKAGIDLGLNNR